MAYEIIIRSQRSRDPPLEYSKMSAEASPGQGSLKRLVAANDNGAVWLLVPFPEGWYGA
jgi:hypothetical protein